MIDIYNFNHLIRKKVVIVASIIFIGLGIGLVIKGPVGSGSYYAQNDASTWLYVVTIIAVLIVALICFATLASPIRPVGSITGVEDQITINHKGSTEYGKRDLQGINIQYNPNYKRVESDKSNYTLEISTANQKNRYDIILSVNQKKVIDDLAKKNQLMKS